MASQLTHVHTCTHLLLSAIQRERGSARHYNALQWFPSYNGKCIKRGKPLTEMSFRNIREVNIWRELRYHLSKRRLSYLPHINPLSIKLATHIFRLKYGWLILRVEDIIFESVEQSGFPCVSIPNYAEFLVYRSLGHSIYYLGGNVQC